MTRDEVNRLFAMEGRVVIVTGGSRGIGLGLARGYAAAGAKVVVASRKEDACNAAAAELRELGGAAIGVATHMGDLDALRRLVERAVEEFGGIDVVVNNAANALAQPLGELTAEAWQKSFDVNLRGPVFLVQEALPHLSRSSHGAVLNFIAGGAYGWAGGISMYSAAKAALASFTRAMAAELAPLGIRVNGISPGPFLTDMFRNVHGDVTLAEASEAFDKNLMGRVAPPEEMIGPALFLTSEAASFVTGQVINVDGGLVASR